MGGKWWLFGGPSYDHNAELDQAGRWPLASVGLRAGRFLAERPAAAPPGWYAGNVPASGDWIPIPVYYLQQKRTLQQLNMALIGPTDQTTNQANALQAALAQTLRDLQRQQGG